MYSSYCKAIQYDEVDKKSEDGDDRQSIDFGSESENSAIWENEPDTSSTSPIAICFVFSQTLAKTTRGFRHELASTRIPRKVLDLALIRSRSPPFLLSSLRSSLHSHWLH